MSREYQQAIEILSECVQGKREVLPLLFTVAKLYPVALIGAVSEEKSVAFVSPIPDWVKTAHSHIEAFNKVSCIKEIRAAKTLSLKQAVDLVNKYQIGSGLEAFRDIVDPLPF
jgi:ribosomal protein L7/L12